MHEVQRRALLERIKHDALILANPGSFRIKARLALANSILVSAELLEQYEEAE